MFVVEAENDLDLKKSQNGVKHSTGQIDQFDPTGPYNRDLDASSWREEPFVERVFKFSPSALDFRQFELFLSFTLASTLADIGLDFGKSGEWEKELTIKTGWTVEGQV